MTATRPLVADPASVTDWSCPGINGDGEGSHHMQDRGGRNVCAYCGLSEAELRAVQGTILALKKKIMEPAPGSTVNVHQSVVIPDGDIETLIEMAGVGIKYWASRAHHNRNLRVYHVWLDAAADDDLPGTRTLEYNWLAKRLVQLGLGVGDLKGVSPKSHVAGYAREYMATVLAGEPDAGIIDADLADVIVQLAYFNGEVVFG